MTNKMAPIASTLSHCLPVLSRICDRPIHVLLGWPLLCVNLALSCSSNDPSCWTHVGSPLLSDWGIKVSSCKSEAGLESILDPVWSLAQVDTLVDEGGGPSAHLCLCKASPSLFGLLGVGIALEEVLGILPIEGRALSVQHPLVFLQESLLDGATLESMYIGDDAKVVQDFDGLELPPGKQLIEVEATEVSVVNERARGNFGSLSCEGFCVLSHLPCSPIHSPDGQLSVHEPKAHVLGMVELVVFSWDVDGAVPFDRFDPGESWVVDVADSQTGSRSGVATTSIFLHLLLITKGLVPNIVVRCLGMRYIFRDEKCAGLLALGLQMQPGNVGQHSGRLRGGVEIARVFSSAYLIRRRARRWGQINGALSGGCRWHRGHVQGI